MNQAPSPHIRVACYVRKASLVAPVDETLRQLDCLEADGVVDEFAVDVWPAEVRLTDDSPHRDVVALFEEFDAWATQWDVSIRPPFAVDTRQSEVTGETREVLLTPVQCLAIYVNGILTEVFPHAADRTGDGDVYTVRDALTLLDEHDIQGFGAGQPPATPPDQRTAAPWAAVDPDRCPACATPLVTGQGVYACPDCEWTATATGPGEYRPLTGPGAHARGTAPTADDTSPLLDAPQ